MKENISLDVKSRVAQFYGWTEGNRLRGFESFEQEVAHGEAMGYQLVSPNYFIPGWAEALGMSEKPQKLYVMRNFGMDEMKTHFGCYAGEVSYPLYFKVHADELGEIVAPETKECTALGPVLPEPCGYFYRLGHSTGLCRGAAELLAAAYRGLSAAEPKGAVERMVFFRQEHAALSALNAGLFQLVEAQRERLNCAEEMLRQVIEGPEVERQSGVRYLERVRVVAAIERENYDKLSVDAREAFRRQCAEVDAVTAEMERGAGA